MVFSSLIIRLLNKRLLPAAVFFLAVLPAFVAGCGNGQGFFFPSITVSSDSASGTPPLTVTFQVSTSDSDGTVTKVEADFTGGGTFTDITGRAVVSFSYSSTGVFTATFRATDNDGRATTTDVEVIVANVGDVAKTLDFPAELTTVTDAFFQASTGSFWLLGRTGVTSAALFRIDASTGVVLTRVSLVDPRFIQNSVEHLTMDSSSFWMTTSAGSSVLFRVDTLGNILTTVSCPATTLPGFCTGLAFDGTLLWTGATDNLNLVRFLANGVIERALTSPDSDVRDIAYDLSADELLVVTANLGRVFRIDPTDGTVAASTPVGFTRGDWDGTLFWFVDNSARELKGVFIN